MKDCTCDPKHKCLSAPKFKVWQVVRVYRNYYKIINVFPQNGTWHYRLDNSALATHSYPESSLHPLSKTDLGESRA